MTSASIVISIALPAVMLYAQLPKCSSSWPKPRHRPNKNQNAVRFSPINEQLSSLPLLVLYSFPSISPASISSLPESRSKVARALTKVSALVLFRPRCIIAHLHYFAAGAYAELQQYMGT